MKKTYEMKNNLEYNNISNNLQNSDLYNTYLPQDFERNMNVTHL